MNYKKLSDALDSSLAEDWFRKESSDETLSKIFGLDFGDEDFDEEVVDRWNRLSKEEKISIWQRHKND